MIDGVSGEDIIGTICISWDEIRGIALKEYIPSIGSDGSSVRITIPHSSTHRDTHEGGRLIDSVSDEGIRQTIRISWNEIRGSAPEYHIPSIGSEGIRERTIIPHSSTHRDTHELDRGECDRRKKEERYDESERDSERSSVFHRKDMKSDNALIIPYVSERSKYGSTFSIHSTKIFLQYS